MPPAARRSALARLSAVVVLALGLVLAAPATASAHTGLRATEPAADSTVTTTPQAVTLTFTASVLGGDVTVTGPDGTPVGAGAVAHDGAVLTAPVVLTAAGRHTVTWSAVAADGHPLDGTFTFEHAPATPMSTTPLPTSPSPTTASPTPPSPTTAVPTPSPAPESPADPGTDPASASSDADGLPGWVLPGVGAVVLLAVAALTVRGRRRRRG
ncbi:hypothetical protein SAMN05660464_3215 [Geodermatophilus dictyosporus]|uniref:CopC domain-containing protein n=1 Tax=Geodermatophilus dictyosporus TaxID=1523247 RepID=A0A1I5QM13_9ACTN|nr:copper resistance CopC family protein [Geodermatophilus dictyosporus]SFP47110.1 hypothetical protein SAMN05660464_3215 [Geodermatophilus dictyosporus]